jgi:UDP-N-acetylglucosamine diphosphorylase / glucose-1-phosphate thymidylyltransferase / UDP-N-acetylgalactosamine diphosphorylase / glucosamine-1-phosphate N-acetyltransferase / galactosamine-1-phosphate N-acetyltransferase
MSDLEEMIKQAVIMVAGDATRMRPLTDNMPKCMIELNCKPLLAYTIDILRNNGINNLVLIVGYKKKVIQDYFKTNYTDMKVQFVEQRQRLGTGHAVKQAEPYIKGEFMVANGDVLFENSLIKNLLSDHKTGEITITAEEVPDARPYGALIIKDDMITDIIEKSPNPPTNLINAGFYIFPKGTFRAIKQTKKSPRGEYELTDSVRFMINFGVITRPSYYNGARIELTSPADVPIAEKYLKK